MNEAPLTFQHRWWHALGIWVTIVVSGALGTVCTYAALFEPPIRSGQWLPLIAVTIAAWGTLFSYVRLRNVPKFEYRVSSSGVEVLNARTATSEAVGWGEIVEVHRGSNLTGCGFIRSTLRAEPYRFCNWFGEANEFVALVISQCQAANDA